MIFFSAALVAARSALSFDQHLPLIGYENFAAVAGSIAATYANASYPVTNLENPLTTSKWLSTSTADQYVTVTVSEEGATVDYLAIARHNLGSTLCVVSVEAITAEPGAVWTEVYAEQLLADDTPAIFQFTEGAYVGVRLKMQPVADYPEVAILYTGKMLQVQRGVQVGYTPISKARKKTFVNGRTHSGDYRDRLIVKESLESSVSFKDFDPTWYRTYMDPFVDNDDPFFFAWSPVDHPTEVGFCWFLDDPLPLVNQRTGEIDLDVPMGALIT